MTCYQFLLSIQFAIVCHLHIGGSPALNMWPDIKSNIEDMKSNIVIRPRYETVDSLGLMYHICYSFTCYYLSDPSPIIVYPCNSLTHSLLFSKLDWCNPGVWRFQLKTCWCCNCCWRGSCPGKMWSWSLASFFCWCFVEVMKLNLCRYSEAKFGQDFEA